MHTNGGRVVALLRVEGSELATEGEWGHVADRIGHALVGACHRSFGDKEIGPDQRPRRSALRPRIGRIEEARAIFLYEVANGRNAMGHLYGGDGVAQQVEGCACFNPVPGEREIGADVLAHGGPEDVVEDVGLQGIPGIVDTVDM